nr:MAG: peptidase S39 [Crogonang virus 44]
MRMFVSSLFWYIWGNDVETRGSTIMESYWLCYDHLSENEKYYLFLFTTDGIIIGKLTRLISICVSSVYMLLKYFPNTSVRIKFFTLLQMLLSAWYYLVMTAIFVSQYRDEIYINSWTNLFEYREVLYIFMALEYTRHKVTLTAMLVVTFCFNVVTALVKSHVDRLIYAPDPSPRVAEHDIKHKSWKGGIVDMSWLLSASHSLLNRGLILEAVMPQSDFMPSKAPKFQVFFTANDVVIGSGFVTAIGVVTCLHVYNVIDEESKTKKIRILGPKGSANVPAHSLRLARDCAETVVLIFPSSLYSMIGATAIKAKNIKPPTPGPVCVYGYVGGETCKSMGSIRKRTSDTCLNHEHTASTLAGFSGSPLIRNGTDIVLMHIGCNGVLNVGENLYVAMGIDKALHKKLKVSARKQFETDLVPAPLVLEAFHDTITTPSYEDGALLDEQDYKELRAMKQAEAEDKYKHIADEEVRKYKIKRDMFEYDDDMKHEGEDAGFLMEVVSELAAFGSLSEGLYDRLQKRTGLLAKRGNKNEMFASKMEEVTVVPSAAQRSLAFSAGASTSSTPQLRLEPRPPSLADMQFNYPEPESDFRTGPKVQTVKTPSTSSEASTSAAVQVKSTIKISETSLPPKPKSQQTSPIPLPTQQTELSSPPTILTAPDPSFPLALPQLSRAARAKLRKSLTAEMKALDTRMREIRSLLATDTNQASPKPQESSQQPSTSQPSGATNTLIPVPSQKNGV